MRRRHSRVLLGQAVYIQRPVMRFVLRWADIGRAVAHVKSLAVHWTHVIHCVTMSYRCRATVLSAFAVSALDVTAELV